MRSSAETFDVTSNKQRAIRNMLTQLGLHATPKRVVDELESYGIEVNEKFVVRVKDQMRRELAKAVVVRSSRLPKAKSHGRPQQRKIPPRRG